MPITKAVEVQDLSLDLANYRTVRQPSEEAALEAMIDTRPDHFWALTDSLLRDGYLPTETVIVLKGQGRKAAQIVKEGNRRVAALKLIHGLLPRESLAIPANILDAIDHLSPQWMSDNKSIPCAVYEPSEAAKVDRIVALTHGKGEKAGRDQWNAVARARHNRDVNNASEPALDLLERYLQQGKNVTARERARWAGDYPLTVLEDAAKRLAPRLGKRNSVELAASYPALAERDALEAIIHDIGRQDLGFEAIRSKEVDFAEIYGLPAVSSATGAGSGSGTSSGSSGTGSGSGGSAGGAAGGGNTTGASGKTARGRKSPPKPKAVSTTDPKAVRQLLKEFTPRGKKREKVEELRIEATLLDLTKTPLAFCFVLRSMFEISAKAYCADHAASGLTVTKSGGQDRALVDVLRDITAHLTKNNTDKEMVKALHGAMVDLAKSNGILSVTSMNQLVHNARFSVAPGDVAIMFGNIFPLLEAMNS